jgi:hypothetical protein
MKVNKTLNIPLFWEGKIFENGSLITIYVSSKKAVDIGIVRDIQSKFKAAGIRLVGYNSNLNSKDIGYINLKSISEFMALKPKLNAILK